MTHTQAAVYTALIRACGPISPSQLALQAGMKEPTVRRCVQELRDAGHNITYATGSNAAYTLHLEAK